MLNYRYDLKQKARVLRSTMTDAEEKLWFHLRRKQILGVQFYRQKSVGKYIVDFLAPSVGLVIEADGGQHAEAMDHDKRRTVFLTSAGLHVMRFNNLQILNQTQDVLDMIYRFINNRQSLPIYPDKNRENP